MIAAVSQAAITLTKREAIAELRLDRPERGNPIDVQLLGELEDACATINDDPSVHAVLLTAAGDLFSAGWDLQPGDEAALHAARAHVGERLPFRCIELMAPPVIACLEGNATGAGLELALACDVRIAAEGIMLALPDVSMGTIPWAGGTQRLPRLIGRAKALEMVLLGEPVRAAEALRHGLVNAVAPRADVRAQAEALAGRIGAQGPLALRYAKEAVARGLEMPLDQALRFETDLTVILQTTADRAEGVRAFLEKRPPRFTGA
jgi:enoyl-CoA hydratase/carnithine racemase